MQNDQWFLPGDKVMRVSSGSALGTAVEHPPSHHPQYGVVYCVEDCWAGPLFNAVMLVGFGGWQYQNGMKAGWQACAFRKVEEIKLCVMAISHAKAPMEILKTA